MASSVLRIRVAQVLLALVFLWPLPTWAIVVSSGSGRVTAQDEGDLQGTFSVLNCTGAGITCAPGTGGRLDIAVSGVAEGALADPGGNGLVNRTALGVTAAYAGTSCTNQVLRVLSAAGAGTCVTVTSAYVDASICTTAGVCTGYQASLGFTAEDTANKSASASLGTSTTLFPTQSAVKSYVDTADALKQNILTWGAGLTATGATPRLATEEAQAITNGGPGNLTAGAGNGGKFQILSTGALQYTGYETPPLLHTGFLFPYDAAITATTCTNDPNGGKLTLSGGVIVCATDQGGSAASGGTGLVQFSTGSALGSDTPFTYDSGEDRLSVPRLIVGSQLNIPHSTDRPGTCSLGDQYMDTNEPSGRRYFLCESANTWVLQGDGVGGGGGDISITGSPTSGQAAEWTTSSSLQGVAVTGTGSYVKGSSPTLTTPQGLVKGDVGLENVDNTSDATKNSAVRTETNARYQPRTDTHADESPIAVDIDDYNDIRLAELSQATTFSIPTGTPFHGETLTFTIYTTVARALTFTTGTNGFAAENGIALPTTTDGLTYAVHVFRWNAISSKWGYVGGTQTTGRGTTGQCYISNGAGAEPSFQSCIGGSTGVTAADTMVSGNLVHSAGDRNVSDSGIAASAVTTKTGAEALSGKRIAPRMAQLSAASGTVTAPNADVAGADVYYRLDVAGTLTIPAFTGTPVPGQRVVFILKSAAPQTVSFATGAAKAFSADTGMPLPTTTTGDGTVEDHWGFRYNAVSDRFVFEASTTLTGPLTPAVLRLPNSTTLPATCTVGDIYFDSDAAAGQNVYTCTATNVWTHPKRYVTLECVPDATALTTGDGKCYFPIHPDLNGWVVSGVSGHVGAVVSSSGAVNVDVDVCGAVATGIRCSGSNRDLLSTNLTIDANEDGTETAAAAAVINTSNDDLATGEWLRVNIDSAGTSTQGFYITFVLSKP